VAGDPISRVFGEDLDGKVRYINLVPTSISGTVKGMYVIDGYCNLFASDRSKIRWYRFDASGKNVQLVLEKKSTSGLDHVFVPETV
jgi:hypothetical protein